MSIQFKEGVLLNKNGVGISNEILIALLVAEGVWTSAGIHILVVTSLLDGVHSANSLHYKGLAADLRTRGTGMASRLTDFLKKALPPGFDVILEDNGGPNEHCHVEWDPK